MTSARYCHRRASDPRPKRDQQTEAAAQAGGKGTEWAGDLEPDGRLRQ